MSYYTGTNPYVMHEADRAFRRSRWVLPDPPALIRRAPPDNLVAAFHEATHTCFNQFTDCPVHSVRLDHNGGGRFQTHAGDVRQPTLTGREPPLKVPSTADDRLQWVKLLVGQQAPLVAQRRYAGYGYDGIAKHDQLTIDRVLSCISTSTAEQHQMRAEVERRARRFVALHWCAIRHLAHALYRRGALDKYEIMDELELARATPMKLNQAGANYAASLVGQGKVNFGPFAWDSPDNDEAYFLGVTTDDSTEPQLHFPFGNGNEVYLEALHAAVEEGGLVGEYAQYLLDVISKQKKQSYQPKKQTPEPRRLRRDAGDFRWRTDGWLVPIR
jgi:hypothetical protein